MFYLEEWILGRMEKKKKERKKRGEFFWSIWLGGDEKEMEDPGCFHPGEKTRKKIGPITWKKMSLICNVLLLTFSSLFSTFRYYETLLISEPSSL